jgi:acetyl-CoA carboxylase biotin carboxyl carrier protein
MPQKKLPNSVKKNNLNNSLNVDSDLDNLIETLTILEKWLMKSGLEEVEVGREGRHMRLKKPSLAAPAAMAAAPMAAVAASAPVPAAESGYTFKAPLVGTFYAAGSPEAKPFVQVGTAVKQGQVVGIIEAMKTMNQITTDTAGVVQKVLIQNGQPVEFGQPLFVIA